MHVIVNHPVPVTENRLRRLAREARGKISRLYLHWTAGHYGQVFDDYHICVDHDGQVYVTCGDLCERKNHTWRRNSGTVGIAMCCACSADCRLPANGFPRSAQRAYSEYHGPEGDYALVDYGDEPPTEVQIEVTAKIVAILCRELGLTVSADAVLTHCEIAFKDRYGPGDGDPETKWDLWFLPDFGASGRLVPGGGLLRGKAEYYRREMDREGGRKATA